MNENELPDVTIVIPSFNDAPLLRRNLPAVLAAARHYPARCTVTVVDDASTAGDRAGLDSEFPAVTWIRREHNGGFGAAVGTGASAADTPFLVLLNSDVAPQPNFLAPLIRALLAPDVFAASPLILEDNGGVHETSWNRRRLQRGRLRALSWDATEIADGAPRPTLFTSGGSMAVRRSAFLALGGFAALFRPFYVEDLDLGVRAWRSGLQVLFVPESRVAHQQRGSIATHFRRRTIKRAQHRNRLLFEWAHLPGPWLWLSVLHTLRRLAGRALRGDLDYLAAFAAALGRLDEVARHRAGIRRQSVRDLAGVLEQVNQPPVDRNRQ